MARIENFVPVLLSGRVESHGTNFINYQLSTGEVRNLPLGDHHLSLFKMLNGTYSLSEIIMNLFKTEEQPLNVGTLLNVLSMLGNQRMFKNNDDMMEALQLFVDGKNYKAVQNVVSTEDVDANYFDESRLMMILKNTALNAKNDDKVLMKIIRASKLHLFPEGEMVIQEGAVDDSLYVLLTGEVGVYTQKEYHSPWEYISTISAVSVFGESSAIDGKKRTATVLSTEDSWILEVPFKRLVNVKKEETYSSFNSLRTRIAVNLILQSAPMFSGLPADAMNEFVKRCELVHVEKGLDVIFEKTADELTNTDVVLDASAFYFIIKGDVEVLKHGEKVGDLTGGDYFGEVGALNKMGRTATCRATSDCKLLTLSAESLNQVFARNFRLALQIEKIAEERIEAALAGPEEDEVPISPIRYDMDAPEVTGVDFDILKEDSFVNEG